MAKPKRLSKKILQEDREAYAALQAIADYDPSNEAFSLANITASHDTMNTDQTKEIQKQADADAASDKADASERKFHNDILGAKNQVKAQFGEDSDQYASLGMKKKSEYRKGGRRGAPDDDTTP